MSLAYSPDRHRPRTTSQRPKRKNLHRFVIAVVVFALATMGVLSLPAGTATAAATVPFDVKYSANANGAIITIGNNLLTCAPGSVSTTVANVPCADARNGAAVNNNSYTMTYLDADADPSTFNSSSSTLALPPGASVLWAGLYWGARLTAGTGGTSSSASAINQMSLRAPGTTAYQTVTASSAAHDQFGPNTASYSAYQRYADITSIVRSAGSGAYWGANVVTGTGQDRYAGWAMTVVYTAPGLPLRNLTVFDGFALVQSGSPQTITVRGFQAPLSGTVDTQVSLVAYEGDLGQAGDSAMLNGTQLATDLSPGSNFFNSTNDLNGTSVTTRTPADRNMLGFDIKNLGASGAIGNGDTTAQFTFSSTGDTYYPGVLGLAINLYAPDFTASAKTVVNLNGNSPARPGDTLRYTLSYANTGQDPARGVVSRDVLPPNTTYVPGSLALVNPLLGTTTPLTDAAGDDAGEYNAATRTVQVRLGGGATATSGGRMACSGAGCVDDSTSRTYYTFQVKLDTASADTTVTNVADLDYVTATTGISADYRTTPASISVISLADVSIAKVLSPNPARAGATVTATLTVTNRGPDVATGVTVTDPIPAGWTNVSVVSPSSGCAIAGAVMTCNLGSLTNGQVMVISLTGSTPSSSTATSLTNVATVTTTAIDPVPSNNVASSTIALNQQADLSITKQAVPASAVPGSPVTWIITAKNLGPSDARNVRVVDTLNTAGQATLSGATIDAPLLRLSGTCPPPTGPTVSCDLTSLAAGATATMTVTGQLAANLAQGTSVGDTAKISADTPDPNLANNTATATLTATAPQADLRVTKSGPTSVVAGQPISWTVTATNYGPSDAASVVVTDPVPGGVSDLRATTTRGDPCQIAGQTVTCAAGTLSAASGAVTVTITGTVSPDATGPLGNRAWATAATADPVSGNNTASTTTAVTTLFDLGVTKTADRTTLPTAGTTVKYTITVTNYGPSTATGVVVTDLLPNVLAFNTATLSDGSCTGPVATSDPSHDKLTCTLTSAIPPGGSQVIGVNLTAPTDLSTGDPITQTASVTAPGDDQTKLGNNTATWTLTDQPQADLSLAKFAPATVTAGTPATYTLDVANNDLNTSVPTPVVTDTLPAGVTLVPFSSSATDVLTPAWCTADTATPQTVTCDLPDDLAPGDHEQFQLTVSIDPGIADSTVLVNKAHAATSSPTLGDPAPENNDAQATSTVIADGDLAVEDLTITPVDTAYTGPGSQRTISFTLLNNGPAVAQDVTFRSVLGTDATVDLSTLPFAGNCTVTGRELVCVVAATLTPGQSVDVTYVITLPGDAPAGTFPTTVEVYGSTPDADLTNNDASADIVVDSATQTDLIVTKTALDTVDNPNVPTDPSPAFVAGGPFAYQIAVQVGDPGTTSQAGLADALNVILTDTLPAGFSPQYVSSADGTCIITSPGGTTPVAGGTAIRCVIDRLASGADGSPAAIAVVAVSGVLSPNAVVLNGGDSFASQVNNTATATTGTALIGARTQVTGSTLVDVINQADLQLAKTADEATVNAGGSIGYTLTVINAGPSAAAHAVVTDVLPAGFTFDPTASPDCAAPLTTPVDEIQAEPKATPGGSDTVIACRIAALDAGASASIHIVANTSYLLAPGTATNTAAVGALSLDPDWSDNTASADVSVTRLTDLGISASVSTTTPAAGQDITFTGYAVNNGPSSADNTTGSTLFPVGFVPVSFDVPYNHCTWAPEPPADPQTAPWQNIAYTLTCVPMTPGAEWEPGGAATNVVVMHIPDDTPAGAYEGSSTITSTTPETALDNNQVDQQLVVQHVSDVQVTKTLVGGGPIVAGQSVTWRLTATNNGPSVADNLEISDTVPPGMTYVSARIDGGAACPAPDYENGQFVVQCSLPHLGVGASATVSAIVVFKLDPGTAGQPFCNTAFVGSGSLDPDAANNYSQSCGMAEKSTPGEVTPPAPLGGTAVVRDPDSLALIGVTLAIIVVGAVMVLTSGWRRDTSPQRRRGLPSPRR